MVRIFYNRLFIVIVSLSLLLVGCENKQMAGTAIGAGAGALIGSRFGGGTGQIVATGVGAVAGGLVGNQVGQSMDRTDQMSQANNRYYYDNRYYANDSYRYS